MSKDPAGHVRFSVRDLQESVMFYEQLFAEIGGTRVSEKGWTTCTGFGLWLAQAEVPPVSQSSGAPGLHHLCLKTERKEQVDDVHAFLVERILAQRDVAVISSPRHYPQYGEIWYALSFLDPDSIPLEVAYY